MDYRNITTLSRAIKGLVKTSAKLTTLVDQALLGAVYHAVKDGQITPGVDLVDAVPRSMKPDVVLYLTKFGPFSYSPNKFVHLSCGKLFEGICLLLDRKPRYLGRVFAGECCNYMDQVGNQSEGAHAFRREETFGDWPNA